LNVRWWDGGDCLQAAQAWQANRKEEHTRSLWVRRALTFILLAQRKSGMK